MERLVLRPSARRLARGVAFLTVSLLLASCRHRPPLPPEAEPVASIFVLAGEIKRHTAHDFYRRPWPRDAAGYNPFRAGLVRLANHENLFPGRQSDVVAFLRGECLLFLREYGDAARAFESAAGYPGELADAARQRRAAAAAFERAVRLDTSYQELDAALAAIGASHRAVEELRARYKSDPGLARLALVELESLDVARARFLTDYHALTDQGLEGAVAAWRAVISAHAQSYRLMSHRLALGRLLEDAAMDYLQSTPPETFAFDLATFLRPAELAREEYRAVAQADGYRERPIGAARLAALNALIEETTAAAQ